MYTFFQGEEEDLPAGMSEVAEQLSDARLMKHADKDVRLTTACCLMDVLRIYAPDAPYSEDTLEVRFKKIKYTSFEPCRETTYR